MDVPVIFVITHRQSKKDKNYYFCFFPVQNGVLYPLSQDKNDKPDNNENLQKNKGVCGKHALDGK